MEDTEQEEQDDEEDRPEVGEGMFF